MYTETIPRGIQFMTDKDLDRLNAYFRTEEIISHTMLMENFKLTPNRICSLVLSNILDQLGSGRESRYRPGKLWYASKTHYRYGSKDLGDSIRFMSWRLKEDYERAFMFRPGDVVGRTWSGDTPGKKGVVIHVMPVIRKILVRWPYGTYQEDADTIQLVVRDNGSRQIDVPTIDKDILDDYDSYTDFKFDPEAYKLRRDEFRRWSLKPSDVPQKEDKKVSNYKFKGSLAKVNINSERMKRVANVLTKNTGITDNLNADYLLTQSEIIVSVNTEHDNPRYKDTPWYITPETADNVNDNGDAWTSPVILNSYKTFRGAYNFYEHEQDIKASKGRVLDSILRKIPLGNDKFYYAVEILVATNKKHSNLTNRIEKGDLKTLSMGCSAAYTVCSQCGNVSYSPETKCEHLLFRKGSYFFDQYGQKRIVAELCGSALHPDSVEFDEASFVEVPAWRNAKVHNIIAKSTSLVNVVGYLTTRLYNKSSVEFLLADGKIEDVKLDLYKKKASEEKPIKMILGTRKTAGDDFPDLDGILNEGGEESAEPIEVQEPAETEELYLGEFYDEPIKYEGLLGENLID